MTVARLSFAAAVLAVAAFLGVARAEDKKEAPKADSIDFHKLKDLMPAELNGLKRSECNGERNRIGEMSISQVTATYKKGDDDGAPKIEVQVIDYSNLEMAKGMAAAWTTIEIDKESDSGFEKTVKVASNPGFLTWQKEGKHGQVQLLVGSRYVVSVQTDNIPSEQVIKVAEALPLDKLAALK
jgi:hypothetical protein